MCEEENEEEGVEIHLQLLCAPAVNPLCFHSTYNAVQQRAKLAD